MDEFLPLIESEFISLYDSEAEYRADSSCYNYSLLKGFETEKLQIFRAKYIDKTIPFKTSVEMDLGSLVDCKLFEPWLVEDKFVLASANIPTPNNEKFINCLLELIGDGEVEPEYFEQAYNNAEIKSPLFPKFLEKFAGSEAEIFFKEKLEGRGKITLGLKEFEASERCHKMLVESENTKELFSDKYERKSQLPIKFSYRGKMFRILVDLICIDHENKRIFRFDLKTTATNVNDFIYQYFNMKYYIQDSLYSCGTECWARHFYPDYSLEPFRFIVQDSAGYSEPLIYEIAFPEFSNPMEGFEARDKYYKGPLSIVEDIEYHLETGIWSTTRTNKLNKGQIKIQL